MDHGSSKVGYIISMFGKGDIGEWSADGFGHDSILGPIANPNFNGPEQPTKSITVEYDKATTIGVSAYSSGGVQLDSIKNWTNKNGWYKKLRIGTPMRKYWKWTSPVTGYTVTDYPSDSAFRRAADDALIFLGAAYCKVDFLSMFNLQDVSTFWCSKLVWRCWYDVSSQWELNGGRMSLLALAPSDTVTNADPYKNVYSFSF